MATFELVPQSWLSSNYSVLRGDATVAEIANSWWRTRGVLKIDGRDYGATKVDNAFILDFNGAQLARAANTSWFSRSFTVQYEGKTYSLAPKTWFSGSFSLRQNGVEIGFVSPHGIGRKAGVQFPDNLPVHFQIFVVWLVIIQWDSDAAVAVS